MHAQRGGGGLLHIRQTSAQAQPPAHTNVQSGAKPSLLRPPTPPPPAAGCAVMPYRTERDAAVCPQLPALPRAPGRGDGGCGGCGGGVGGWYPPPLSPGAPEEAIPPRSTQEALILLDGPSRENRSVLNAAVVEGG